MISLHTVMWHFSDIKFTSQYYCSTFLTPVTGMKPPDQCGNQTWSTWKLQRLGKNQKHFQSWSLKSSKSWNYHVSDSRAKQHPRKLDTLSLYKNTMLLWFSKAKFSKRIFSWVRILLCVNWQQSVKTSQQTTIIQHTRKPPPTNQWEKYTNLLIKVLLPCQLNHGLDLCILWMALQLPILDMALKRWDVTEAYGMQVLAIKHANPFKMIKMFKVIPNTFPLLGENNIPNFPIYMSIYFSTNVNIYLKTFIMGKCSSLNLCIFIPHNKAFIKNSTLCHLGNSPHLTSGLKRKYLCLM